MSSSRHPIGCVVGWTVLTLLASGCGASSTEREYTLQGQVLSVASDRKEATIKHEEIKGFMAAMEMSYPVSPPTLLNSLNPGDKIGFTIDVAKSTIVKIEMIEAAK